MMSYEKYYLCKNRINDLATTALIVFDSSALLNIYELSPNAQNDIFDNVLDKIRGRLWIPERVSFEFQKNRSNVSEKPIKNYQNLFNCENKSDGGGYVNKIISCVQIEFSKCLESLKGQYQALKEICTDNQKHPIILQNKFTNFDKALDIFCFALSEFKNCAIEFENEIKEVIEKEIQSIKAQLETDTIPQRIFDLFKIGDELSFEELFNIAQEGQLRYSMDIPPGYGDIKKKHGLAVYGDLILWKQLLIYAFEQNKSVLFISNDKKDWMDKEHNAVPRIELLQEFYSATNGQYIWILNLSDFLHLMHDVDFKQQDVTVNDATLQEVENVIASSIAKAKDGQIHVDNDDIAESGYKIISQKSFLAKLESMVPFYLNDNKFLSSKYFVETILAREGYDIASSWDVFNSLTAKGEIIEYKHDPNNGYPTLSAVCLPEHVGKYVHS